MRFPSIISVAAELRRINHMVESYPDPVTDEPDGSSAPCVDVRLQVLPDGFPPVIRLLRSRSSLRGADGGYEYEQGRIGVLGRVHRRVVHRAHGRNLRRAGALVIRLSHHEAAILCALSCAPAIDGTYAKETVLSLVAMKPGDTDAEYFEAYTDRQSAWAGRYGEWLNAEREARYCDANGAVRE